jgi:hypothetical protein
VSAPAALSDLRVADALMAALPVLDPAVLAPEARLWLLAVGRDIALTSGCGLECHLGQPATADMAVRILPHEQGLPSWLASAFSRMARVAPIIWREFDWTADGSTRESVFAGPGNPPSGRARTRFGLADWQHLIGPLFGQHHSPAHCARLTGLQERLPPHAWIGYAGLMRGDPARLRVLVSGLRSGDIRPLLDGLGWRGAWDGLATLSDHAGAPGGRLQLALDLGERTGSRIGLELALDPDGDWPNLLAAAGAIAGWSPRVVPGLLAWPGETHALPPNLLAATPGLIRRLNHIKLSQDGFDAPSIKAYLYLGTVPR